MLLLRHNCAFVRLALGAELKSTEVDDTLSSMKLSRRSRAAMAAVVEAILERRKEIFSCSAGNSAPTDWAVRGDISPRHPLSPKSFKASPLPLALPLLLPPSISRRLGRGFRGGLALGDEMVAKVPPPLPS